MAALAAHATSNLLLPAAAEPALAGALADASALPAVPPILVPLACPGPGTPEDLVASLSPRDDLAQMSKDSMDAAEAENLPPIHNGCQER